MADNVTKSSKSLIANIICMKNDVNNGIKQKRDQTLRIRLYSNDFKKNY